MRNFQIFAAEWQIKNSLAFGILPKGTRYRHKIYLRTPGKIYFLILNHSFPIGPFLDISDDIIFKRVFGRRANKGVLITLLNRMLPDIRVSDLEYLSPETTGFSREKTALPSAFCRRQRGKTVLRSANCRRERGKTALRSAKCRRERGKTVLRSANCRRERGKTILRSANCRRQGIRRPGRRHNALPLQRLSIFWHNWFI